MRILVINYRYFVSGGPERYMFNVSSLFESHGHTVIPFSITYDRNEPTEYADYFADPIGSPSEIYFREHGSNLQAKLQLIERAFYSPAVYERLASLIAATKPDAAYVLHYLRKLSPAVIKCLSDHRVPFAVFLSDFAMVCPGSHLLRKSRPCELCIGGALRHSVHHRCVQGSRAASAVNYAATRVHQAAGYYSLIHRFVAPSRFMVDKMAEGGIERDRLSYVPMFVSMASPPPPAGRRPAVIAYAGRLEEIKGVHILLKAVQLLNADPAIAAFRVRVAGDGDKAYVASLAALTRRYELHNVQFEGWQTRDQLRELMHQARCSVLPALWYENVPQSALESMIERTPVVASNHGCFPEIVSDGVTGLVAPPGDPAALASALRQMLDGPDIAAEMGNRAFDFVRLEHSPERHYSHLAELLRLR